MMKAMMTAENSHVTTAKVSMPTQHADSACRLGMLTWQAISATSRVNTSDVVQVREAERRWHNLQLLRCWWYM